MAAARVRFAGVILLTALACCASSDQKDAPYEPPSFPGHGGEWTAGGGSLPDEFLMDSKPESGRDRIRKNRPGAPDEKVVHLASPANRGKAEPVTLNVKGASVDAVIKSLAVAAGANIVVHPAVRDRVCADLAINGADWINALETIVRANNLAAYSRGADIFADVSRLEEIGGPDIITIGSYENLRAEQERLKNEAANRALIAKSRRDLRQEMALARKINDIDNMVTESYRFRYADPVEAIAYLEELLMDAGNARRNQPGHTESPDSRADPAAARGARGAPARDGYYAPRIPGLKLALYRAENMITVTAPARMIGEIIGLVKEIDVRPRQVYIEARIVEIQRNSISDLGVQWGGYGHRATGANFPNTVGVWGGSSDPGGVGPNAVSLPAQSAVDPATGDLLASPPGGVIGITLGGVSGTNLLRARLMALENAGNSHTISNPKILSLNGQSAVIKSGKEIPYQASSANTGVNIRFREAVISLNVRANIMEDNRIRLNIKTNKNEVDPTLSVQGTPAIRKKELSTSVVVENGGSAALGGMFEMEDGDFQDRVPWFHKIPGLGWLFKNDRKIDNRLELLVFITPTIVDMEAAR